MIPAARLAVAGLAAACIAAALTTGPAAAVSNGWTPPAPTYRLHDGARGDARQILPAGENGLVNAAQLLSFERTGARPPDSSDQLGPYRRLLYHDRSLTNRQIGKYFVDDSFGVPKNNVTRTERPDPDVRVAIYRGPHDIPHIYGASLSAMAYGAGYAAAEDRLFLMDVLRHYGEGDLASFVGPSCSIEDMDHDQLLAAGYTKTQLSAQLAALPAEYGRAGRQTVAMINSYVAGINRYIARTRTDSALLPADYAAVGAPPAQWSPSDVVATASLIGTEATGGGAELANAGLLVYLQHRLGKHAGRSAFRAFKEQNNPDAPTTIRDHRFPYETPHHVDRALTAIPDHPLAPLAGTPTDTTADCDLSQTPLQHAVSSLLAPKQGESNALLVSGAHSRDHHSLAVFGPELGYYAPEVLMEEDLHAPGYDAAGASFPGASFVVVLGRARHFAWSATTASTDQNDIRVEKLCNPKGGGKVAALATDYRYDGKCRSMRSTTFTETAATKPGGMGAPVVIRHQLHFTRDGVVEGWTTLRHRPVAIVDERSTFMREADSFVGLLKWGEPAATHGPETWIRGAQPISYSFNWLYVGSHHIAYVVSGRDPRRDPHADPNLPTWGTGIAKWRGLLPASRHPHEIDPASGFFTSWNNKPAPGFSASDDMYGWGPVHRVQLIDRQLRVELARHRRLTRANLVTAVEEAATQDLSGVAVVPPVLSYLGHPHGSGLRAMTRQLARWVAAGAHRRTARPGGARYADHAAIAIWDQAYPYIVRSLFDRIFAKGGVARVDGLPSDYRVLPMEFALNPNGDGTHHGDGYYVGWEGYVVTALRQLTGRQVGVPFPPTVIHRLCGRPSRCRAAIRGALRHAYRELRAVNGTADVARWTGDTVTAREHATMPGYDRIIFQSVGIVGQPDIDWQNRPTYQQVIEFPDRRR